MQNNIIDNKIRAIFFGLLFFITIIVLKLFYLQIYLNQKLFTRSTNNFTRIKKVLLPRGNIVDTNNHILVTNRPVINIYWKGTGNKKLNNQQIELLKQLEAIIQQPLMTDQELTKIKINENLFKTILIAQDISFENLGKISEGLINNQNLIINTHFKRFYPHQSIASHIIGYLAQIDNETIGKMGLEKLFEEDLKGQAGTQVTTINSLGNSINSFNTKQPVAGKTLKTTIDLHIQQLTEKIFPNNLKGAMIIMDPENGAIKATLSRPNFDPSTFLNQLSASQWNELQEQQPFLNRAFNASYPPASIFKLISLTAALELNIIKTDTKWFCSGSLNFAGRDYHCAKKLSGHGYISPKEAIVNSCNTFFYNIAKHIHIDDLAMFANKFGLGQKTGIIFAEKTGLIPTKSWKRKTFRQPWWPGETLSAVIGQSYILVTPIQIARMVSAIFQGYLVIPRILQDQEITRVNLNIKKSTLDLLKDSMKTVVTEGTAQRVKIKDFTIYAKTGTAQTVMLDKNNIDLQHLDHAWFISNFSYKNEAPLTLVIFLEHAGSTTIAINAAKQFLLEYKNLIN